VSDVAVNRPAAQAKEMRRAGLLIYSFCLLLGLGTLSYAQDDRKPPMAPEKDYFVEPFDRYGDIPWKYEKARLDNFYISLKEAPNLIGYIVVYAGRRSCAAYAQRRGLRAKKYLVERFGLDWNRVIWKDAGYLEQPYVMLWSQVRGEEPYPFHQPEPLRDMKIKKCRAKARK
jgi:hypothetical protein